MTEPTKGIYRHNKTMKSYDVLGVALHTETDEQLVVYRPLYPSEHDLFARPQGMFCEQVELNGVQVPRFELAGDETGSMDISGDRITAVTHNGKFHADEVTATAVLMALYPELRIVRSRDPDVIAAADIVYDVGGVYDHALRRYDHHQNGALKRADGLTRSALGLIWLHYGELYCDGDARAAERIDEVLIRGVDARDNSELNVIHDTKTPDYGISQVIEQLNPILRNGEDYDTQFVKAVGRSAEILARIKEKVLVELDVEDAVLFARTLSTDSRYAIMEHQITTPDSLANIEGLDYVVFPEYTNYTWQVCAIPTPEDPFVFKRPFPAEWAGLMNEQLARVTGIDDALFCHSKRFLAVAKSREGALALLGQALQ